MVKRTLTQKFAVAAAFLFISSVLAVSFAQSAEAFFDVWSYAPKNQRANSTSTSTTTVIGNSNTQAGNIVGVTQSNPTGGGFFSPTSGFSSQRANVNPSANAFSSTIITGTSGNFTNIFQN